MNKTYIIVAALLVTIIGSGIFVYMRSQSPMTASAPAPANVETAMDAPSPDVEPTPTDNQVATATPGSYKQYSQADVDATKGTKLIFFHAPWCPQCRELDESIRTSDIPDNTTIFKVDYDTNQELRKKYGVTIQTTIVKIDDNGDKISSYVAYQSPTFANARDALLK